MKLMNSKGILKKSEFSCNPSSCTEKPNAYAMQQAQNHKIITFERLAKWDNPYNLVLKTKKALANKNPVVVGMFRYGRLSGPGELWIAPTTPSTGGHAMVVVGYNDDKYGGAFEIMNSWGTRFRNNGFFWVKYADFKKYIKTAYVLVDNSSSPNIDKNITTVSYSNELSGEITLKLSNGKNMAARLLDGAKRNFNIVKAKKNQRLKTPYSIDKAYSSGTLFRIYLNSNQRGYVYLIGYGGSDKSVNMLYPFDHFSPFFNYTNSEISIPNEDYYTEFDNQPGQDILCVLYSKTKLDMNTIINKARYGTEDFVTNVKKAIQHRMFKGSELTFEKDNIAFKAASNSDNSSVVPIFIAVNHR